MIKSNLNTIFIFYACIYMLDKDGENNKSIDENNVFFDNLKN